MPAEKPEPANFVCGIPLSLWLLPSPQARTACLCPLGPATRLLLVSVSLKPRHSLIARVCVPWVSRSLVTGSQCCCSTLSTYRHCCLIELPQPIPSSLSVFPPRSPPSPSLIYHRPHPRHAQRDISRATNSPRRLLYHATITAPQ